MHLFWKKLILNYDFVTYINPYRFQAQSNRVNEVFVCLLHTADSNKHISSSAVDIARYGRMLINMNKCSSFEDVGSVTHSCVTSRAADNE